MKVIRDYNELDSVADLGDNVQILAYDRNHALLRVTDDTGDGMMTIYNPFEGVSINVCDMNLRSCESGFVLKDDTEVLCIDHCIEGRIELEVMPGVWSVLQENQARIDDRRHHNGHVVMPLSHYHGISIYIEVQKAQEGIRTAMPGFTADIHGIRKKFCKDEKPYILKEDPAFEGIMDGLYKPPANISSDYYKLKILELLLYLDAAEVNEAARRSEFSYRSSADKIREIHTQITENPAVHWTISELAEEYDISQTELKATFKEIYGDSIYSYLKRYRMNQAASMLLKNKDMSVTSIAHAMGYSSSGKFSGAFRKVMGTSPLDYRRYSTKQSDNLTNL